MIYVKTETLQKFELLVLMILRQRTTALDLSTIIYRLFPILDDPVTIL